MEEAADTARSSPVPQDTSILHKGFLLDHYEKLLVLEWVIIMEEQ